MNLVDLALIQSVIFVNSDKLFFFDIKTNEFKAQTLFTFFVTTPLNFVALFPKIYYNKLYLKMPFDTCIMIIKSEHYLSVRINQI